MTDETPPQGDVPAPQNPTPPSVPAEAADAAGKGFFSAKFDTLKKNLWSKTDVNGEQQGTTKLVFKNIGAVAGLGAILHGGWGLLRGIGVVSPKTDDKGNEVPPGLLVPLGEIVGGGTLLWAVGLRGPKAAAELSKA